MENVKLENITKQYDDVTAVNDVNLTVEDDEFVTLVGPSGCGKSTTLEMVAGLTTPTEGEVYINGENVTNLPPKSRDIGMVFQNIALFPHLNVYDNISFGLRLRDFDDDEIDRRVDQAAEIVQLEGMLDRMPEELSGGQRQRVAIGRAIVREPEVFLMDEPLANLDAALRVHMRTELQRLHKELDTTIIYVTHDQEEAMTMSNRLAVMNHGEIEQYAPPLTCYNEPATEFVGGFIGSPSMNFYDAVIEENAIVTPFFDVEFDPERHGLSPGRDVRFGIRPEHITYSKSSKNLESESRAITATTDVIEPIGDEVFVYLRLDERADHELSTTEDDDEILMSIPPDPEITHDMDDVALEIRFDRSCVHLFDAETGDALVHGIVESSEPTGSDSRRQESEPDTGAWS